MRKQTVVKNIEVKDFKSSRELVERLLEIFLQEEPYKNYVYVVEKLSDGRRVYLKRPTRRFNFDFEVWVERWDGVNDKRPTHNDIKSDLKLKLQENPSAFNTLWQAILYVHQFEEPEKVLQNLQEINFKTGQTPELILKVLKWMFALEDIYYWNYGRRDTLMNALKNIFQQTL